MRTLALACLVAATSIIFAQEDSTDWLNCRLGDGTRALATLTPDSIRIKNDAGTWRVPLHTVRECKFFQREDDTDVQLIFASGHVTQGKLVSRDVDVVTIDGQEAEIPFRLMESIANPVFGGMYRSEGDIELQTDLRATLVAEDGELSYANLAFSMLVISTKNGTFQVPISVVREVSRLGFNSYQIDTAYGDRLIGKLDPTKLYQIEAGEDSEQVTSLTIRNYSSIRIATMEPSLPEQTLRLEVGDRGERIMARIKGNRLAVFVGEDKQESDINVPVIAAVYPLQNDEWLFQANESEVRARPRTRQLQIKSILDSSPRELDWSRVTTVTRPGSVSPNSGTGPISPPMTASTPAATAFPKAAEPAAFPEPANTLDPMPTDPLPFTNEPVGPTWDQLATALEFSDVLIKGGGFKLGRSDGEGLDDEIPAISVQVRDFYMDIQEVQVVAFQKFVASENYVTSAEKDDNNLDWRNPGFRQQPNEPVVWVSWIDAAEYCNWRSTQMGLTPCYSYDATTGLTCDRTANGFRLPTEAEWEYAVRQGGQPAAYPGNRDSMDIATAVETVNFKQKKGAHFDGYLYTAPASAFAANSLGLFNLTGNVWEWCEDYYHADAYYYILSQKKNDPCVLINDYNGLELRSMRGGSFENERLDFLRAASRGQGPPNGSKSSVGFRCVRTAY